MFLGIDSSTQSISALAIDPTSGTILFSETVNFGKDLPEYRAPSGFIPDGQDGEVHANPLMWLDALDLLFAKLSKTQDLSKISRISGCGQQHGSVYLSSSFEKVLSSVTPNHSLSSQIAPTLTRPTSPIWMDTSTSAECDEITAQIGSSEIVCSLSGSVAVERFTGPQIRKFFKDSPDEYAETASIHLVSSFLASILAGRSAGIDHGDGAGMNLLNLSTLAWDADLLAATAPQLADKLPSPTSVNQSIGKISSYFTQRYRFSPDCEIMPFTGDNPASLVGMGATVPGQAVISLGTSDTFFSAMPAVKTDPKGYGHVFGNPAGGFMSLICFLNGSLAREALRDELKVTWQEFESESLSLTRSSAGKNLALPFYGPEITPRHDFTAPVFDFSEDTTPALKIRALLEGQFLNMKAHSDWIGIPTKSIRLTGGAAQNNGIAQIVADVFQCPVERFEATSSAALGGALIAAAGSGYQLDKLQEKFCRTKPNSLLHPNTELSKAYSEAQKGLRQLLHKSI